MTNFLDELRKGLKKGEIQGDRVLVAVSGGADSVALLVGLVDLATEFSLQLVVGHLNHRLRGAASDADADWVLQLSRSLDLTCERGELADEVLADQLGGLEERARHFRYQFLEAAAARHDCPIIMLAHTSNDQAETVLHHLLRGTGISGLSGIPFSRMTPKGFRLVRPLLTMSRAGIETFLRDRGQEYCTDHTNEDPAMTRNRLRHHVLPLLRKEINPHVDEALARLAEQAADVDEILRNAAQQLLNRCVLDSQAESCRLDTSHLIEQPRHLVREVFRRLWQQQHWSRQSMGFEQWNRLAEMLESRKAIHLPDRVEARFCSETLLVLRRLR